MSKFIMHIEDKELMRQFEAHKEEKDVRRFVIEHELRRQSGDWAQYTNGNYFVEINKKDGTKIRTTLEDDFQAEFPENIDIKITNWCDMACPFCHENSNPEGKHAILFDDENLTAGTYAQKLFNSLVPGTELALGGGKVTSHPYLEELLHLLKRKGIFANITVHEKELHANIDKIQRWLDEDLVKGVGVSITRLVMPETIDFAKKNETVVLHTIAGIMNYEDYKKIASKDIKILILGYKDFRRGHSFLATQNDIISNNIRSIKDNIKEIMNMFKVLSFDNLALNQLDPKSALDEDTWNLLYQGQDSNHTMYIDLVNMTYAGHSTTPEDERFNIFDWNGIDNRMIYDLFAKVKGTVKEGL